MKICLKYMEIVCIQRDFCYNSRNFHAIPLIRGGAEMEEKDVHAIKEHREQWSSRATFIMAAAGSAIGLGNIWRFPYLVGMNGGAAFVIIYILLSVVIGSTVMIAEFTVGRAAQKSTVSAFHVLAKNPFWQVIGWMAMLCGGFVIFSYYGIVGGWTIKYMLISFTGLMADASAGKSGEVFAGFVGRPYEMVLYQCIFMLLSILIVVGGIGKGIERACKVMMPALFVILLVLIFRSVTLPGAEKGIEFYLKPDFSKINGASVLAALGQSFYSLSLGMGIMTTYGSYISKEERLPVCAGWIISMDTMIALMAGLAIFPAVFAMGIEPGSGPGLTFVALPSVFAKMPGGAFFSFLFFLLLFFAAVTSAMSLLEVAVSFGIDTLKMGRAKATWLMGIVITVLGVPSAFSLSGAPKIAGKDFFDAMNYLSDSIMMPIASILLCVFVGWFWLDEAQIQLTNENTYHFRLMKAWIFCLKFIAPIAIAIIFIKGLKW